MTHARLDPTAHGKRLAGEAGLQEHEWFRQGEHYPDRRGLRLPARTVWPSLRRDLRRTARATMSAWTPRPKATSWRRSARSTTNGASAAWAGPT
ncbi:hypothetical protein ACRAWD_25355 [Caulobacter segnis]